MSTTRRAPDVVTVTVAVDGTKLPRRRRSPGPAGSMSKRAARSQMNPVALDVAWRLLREGEVMQAAGPNVIVLAHPGSAAYVQGSLRVG